jgi:hypothetical protein
VRQRTYFVVITLMWIWSEQSHHCERYDTWSGNITGVPGASIYDMAADRAQTNALRLWPEIAGHGAITVAYHCERIP